MKILGIDPGSLKTGFAVIRVSDDESITHLAHGVIFLEDDGVFNLRLGALLTSFKEVLLQYRPDVMVVEDLFLGRNPDSAFKLGHARGVIIGSAVSQNIPVFEYATRLVKKGITGSGAATKEEVALSVQRHLKIEKIINNDASDALAMALYHCHQYLFQQKMIRNVLQVT